MRYRAHEHPTPERNYQPPGSCHSAPFPSLPLPSTIPNPTTIQQRKLILRREHIQARTLHLGGTGWEDDKDVGVCGEAGDDEVEARGFDCEFEELVRGWGGGCERAVLGGCLVTVLEKGGQARRLTKESF